MVMKRRFERIKNMMDFKSYIKNEDVSENKKILIMDSKIKEQIKSILIC